MKKILLKAIFNTLAHYTRKYIASTNPTIIGITGSVGKTSCRMVVTDVLKQRLPDKNIYTSSKNFNSEIGLVLSIFGIEEYTPGIKNMFSLVLQVKKLSKNRGNTPDILVLEYGIDHPGDMTFLTSIARPDYSIFTRLDSVHGAYFGSIEKIGDEKFMLMKNTKIGTYLNAADTYARSHFSDISLPVHWYNGQGIQPKNQKLIEKKGNILSQCDYLKHTITTNLLGDENSYYIALGLDIAEKLGAKKPTKNIHIESYLQPGRYSILKGKKDSIIIDSSYNAAPASMTKMIQNTQKLRDAIYPEYKIMCILGDMRELGNMSEDAHKNIGHELEGADVVITVGPEMKQYLDISNTASFLSSVEAGKHAVKILQKTQEKYIILVKGSQNTIFTEEAVKHLLATKKDISRLVRQSDDWMERKQKFFKSV